MTRYKLSEVKTRKYPSRTTSENRHRTIRKITVSRVDNNGRTTHMEGLFAYKWNRTKWIVVSQNSWEKHQTRRVAYSERDARYFLNWFLRARGLITTDAHRMRDRG